MKTSLFAQFFPTPEVLTPVSVGLDISDQSLKYAELKRKAGELVLGRHGVVAIPIGIVQSGKVQDSAGLVQILKDLKQKEHLHFVRVSLPEEQMYLFEMKIPRVPYNTIRQTIELSIEDHIPVKASDINFDFIICGQSESEYTLHISAIPFDLIQSYLAVLTEADLTPLSFELEAQAIARAIIPKGDQDALMIVDFGETRTGISIVSNGIIDFATTLSIGGSDLTAAIAKTFAISVKEAEVRKRAVGLSRKPEDQEMFDVLLNGISVLRDEINRNFIYWHTHKDEHGNDRPKIQEIIVCGGHANMRGLTEYLGASLRIKVTLANPWINVNTLTHYIPPILADDVLAYSTAIGLALGDFEHD